MENLKYMRVEDSHVYKIPLPPLPASLAELEYADDYEEPSRPGKVLSI